MIRTVSSLAATATRPIESKASAGRNCHTGGTYTACGNSDALPPGRQSFTNGTDCTITWNIYWHGKPLFYLFGLGFPGSVPEILALSFGRLQVRELSRPAGGTGKQSEKISGIPVSFFLYFSVIFILFDKYGNKRNMVSREYDWISIPSAFWLTRKIQ
jgi:hypothetical protein